MGEFREQQGYMCFDAKGLHLTMRVAILLFHTLSFLLAYDIYTEKRVAKDSHTRGVGRRFWLDPSLVKMHNTL